MHKKYFQTKKENKAVKDIIIRDIRNLFEHEEENYYKPVRVNNFWNNNYIEYKSNSDKKLKDIMNNLKKSNTWKTKSRIAINFISCKDNDEEHVMHSKSDKTEVMINDKVDEVIEELYKSLLNRYKNNLEKLMKGIESVFDYVFDVRY